MKHWFQCHWKLYLIDEWIDELSEVVLTEAFVMFLMYNYRSTFYQLPFIKSSLTWIKPVADLLRSEPKRRMLLKSINQSWMNFFFTLVWWRPPWRSYFLWPEKTSCCVQDTSFIADFRGFMAAFLWLIVIISFWQDKKGNSMAYLWFFYIKKTTRVRNPCYRNTSFPSVRLW